MNGLLPQGQAPAPGPDQGMGQPAGDEPENGPQPQGDEPDPNVTPEEQAQYDEFVSNCMKMVYAPEQRKGILQRLGATGQPIDDLANTAVMVVKAVVASAQKAGKPIEDDVVYHGGSEVIADLAEYAEKAKIHNYSQKELEGAWYRALDIYRELGQKDGSVNQDDLKQQFGQVQQADQSGQLDQLLPGIGKAEQGGQTPPPAEDQGA